MKKFSICGNGSNTKESTITEIIKELDECETVSKRKGRNTIEYYNVPCAFDIETSTFMYHGEKSSLMYIWQAGFNGKVITGRTWESFVHLMDSISDTLGLGTDKRLVVYVHNLSFEFQFMRKYFEWEQVFAMDSRKPIYALTTTGIEFRCSYILSGYSLEKLGTQLRTYKINKMVGDLDYSLVRHNETTLTDKEMGYCYNDVFVVMAYIQEKIESDGNITKIPLTKTGYVRNYVRNNCMRGIRQSTYRKLMSTLTLEPNEYLMLKRAFQGGFTHANASKARRVHKNVTSADFTSSYPAVMIAEKFPMSKGIEMHPKNITELKELFKRYCVIFDVEFTNIEPKISYDNPISASKCSVLENPILNNGRVEFADRLVTTITEVDFSVYEKFYEWERMRVGKVIAYEKAYLPKFFVESILKLYGDKTTLKGVKGMEYEYLQSKEMINACYGMVVTDIVRDVIDYDTEWNEHKPTLEEEIAKYNSDKRRFLFYPWGIYVTAYARRNLFTGIYECKDDYLYSDTDSVKVTNINRHMDYFNNYNKNVMLKMEKALKIHGLDTSLVRPKTIKGVTKYLGVWDMEDGFYTRFKTLGAKRYMVEEDNEVNITVSGVNKRFAVPYLLETYGKEVFNKFDDGLIIPATYIDKNGKEKKATGKLTHTYIDEKQIGTITDYNGKTIEFETLSGVYLEPADYKLSMSEVYINFINGKTYLA